MTAYRFLPDSEVAPDGPVLSDTAVAFRDNLLAVIEGDPTAPKIATAAMFAPTAGNTTIWRHGADIVGENPLINMASTVHVLISGTVRVTFTHSSSTGGAVLGVTKNAATVVYTSTQTTTASHTVDVDVSIGDSLHITYSPATSGAIGTISSYAIKSGVSTAAIA